MNRTSLGRGRGLLVQFIRLYIKIGNATRGAEAFAGLWKLSNLILTAPFLD